MDPNIDSTNTDLNSLKTNALNASNKAGDLANSVPSLLASLKSNLTSIFSNDNPMMQQRSNALETFLNAPSQTRASLLPSNMPTVEGSPLNLSPTQQDAIVTSRRNAALVPLAGLNQNIVGQYGNLMELLSNAGGLYKTQADVAQKKAEDALSLYKDAVAEYKASKMYGNVGLGGGDLSSLLSTLFNQSNNQGGNSGDWEVVNPSSAPSGPASPLDFRSAPLNSGDQISHIAPGGKIIPPTDSIGIPNTPINLNPTGTGLSLFGNTSSPFASASNPYGFSLNLGGS